MKRCILLALILISLICKAPVSRDLVATERAAWIQVIPQWENYDMETQDEIIRIYQLSRNKYLWFPDSFPNPHQGQVVIIPDSWSQKKIREIKAGII